MKEEVENFNESWCNSSFFLDEIRIGITKICYVIDRDSYSVQKLLATCYIRSSHKFVPFFERLYMLRLFTYLSVSWKNVIPLSLYNFFPFFW